VTTALLTGALLVYDGDCAFCSTSVRWLEERFPDAFAAQPYQRTDLARLGLTEDEAHARLQWIGDVLAPQTTREQGARAVGALLRRGGTQTGGVSGALWRALGSLPTVPPTSWISAGVYALVAKNRHRLPGGTPTCKL
jgi:predicted DCC family thiol-disulfide oxidoreductase YuxK